MKDAPLAEPVPVVREDNSIQETEDGWCELSLKILLCHAQMCIHYNTNKLYTHFTIHPYTLIIMMLCLQTRI